MFTSVNSYARQMGGYLQNAFSWRLPNKPRQHLFRFDQPEQISWWEHTSDEQWGGKSVSSLSHNPETNSMCFSGEVDTALQGDLKTSGMAVAIARKHPHGPSLQLENFSGFQLQLKGDGKAYFFNLKDTDVANSRNLWQSFIPTIPNQWLNIEIPYSMFFLTNDGFIQPGDSGVLGHNINLFSFSVYEPGPFSLEVKSIDAINRKNLFDNRNALADPDVDYDPHTMEFMQDLMIVPHVNTEASVARATELVYRTRKKQTSIEKQYLDSAAAIDPSRVPEHRKRAPTIEERQTGYHHDPFRFRSPLALMQG